ncbi:MAG TPA: tetratricopeptide repeat protein [Edaphobacter sp.]|nr:tetratricopeptide repeat protein [Edaphobacter sp.]
MKHIGWKWSSTVAACLLLVFAMAHPTVSAAQAAPASVHGHVNNAIGQALNKGDVRLTTDRASDPKSRKYNYTFPIDPNGDYKGTGIAPGNYVVLVFQDDKSLDFNESVVFAAADDKVVNFDMSRKEYIDKMTPEEKKTLEEFKKKNAEAVANNSKIANLNTTLQQARADTKAGNFDAAITAMQGATTAKPDESILWVALGDAQLGGADAAAKALRADGKPLDAAATQKYTDAATSYKKGIDLNAASKKPNPETTAAAYNQLGQALAKQGNTKESSDAYEMAAKATPTNAGMYYFNEAATLYNAGKLDDAAVAADKAIAADPKRPDAYYIKGQSLIPKASVDPKTQKVTAPPGCVDAYQTYLELAPDGPHAADVKGILEGIGEKVKSSYKAGGKK